MGQYDILMFLKEQPDKWFDSKEISIAINVNVVSVRTCLRRMMKSDHVLYKKIKRRPHEIPRFIFKYKE